MGRRLHGGATARRGAVLVVASLSAAALGFGGSVAMADEPVPGDVVVEVGLPPVPPTTVAAAVGLPPVPPTTVAIEVGVPPLPATVGDPGSDTSDIEAGVSSIAGAIAATADAAWRTG